MKSISIISLILLMISWCQYNPPKALFTLSRQPASALSEQAAALGDYTAIDLNADALESILRSQAHDTMIYITVPYRIGDLRIALRPSDLYAPTFQVNRSDDTAAPYIPGRFYTGYVLGMDSSMVSLSIIGDEVRGIISSPSLGDLTIGRISAAAKTAYMIYDPATATVPLTFGCMSPDGGLTTPELDRIKKNKNNPKKEVIKGLSWYELPRIDSSIVAMAAVPHCVTVDLELTYEVYQYFGGSVQKCTDWISSLFSAVRTLYAAEGIDISIKSIYVWTTDDGYNDNAAVALTEVGDRRKNDPAFTASLTHLVRGRTGGSMMGIAYVGVLCIDQYKVGYSEPMYTYAAYPAYSWSVNVLTHEIGHNLGSAHTQWCGWPGGAIDNCYQTEGGCPPGPAPTNGGTIMSYCHMTSYGIKFSNGFGTLPHQAITDALLKASCQSIVCGTVGPPVVPPVVPPSINIALNKPAKQISTYGAGYEAIKAFDGNINTFSHTGQHQYPWIQVDLGQNTNITGLDITARQGCCQYRLREFRIFASSTEAVPAYTDPALYTYTTGAAGLNNVKIDGITGSGRYITLMAKNFQAGDYLHLAEIKVYGGGTGTICKDTIYKVPSVRDSAGKVCR
ncbi:MAG: discoidin domain-containing protein [Saprospiraceae bacterium]|nr:discoidin domain-containing protein [Saprospiraceae bacterium]